MPKKLLLTHHAKDRIIKYDLKRMDIHQEFRSAVKIDLTVSELTFKQKYGQRQTNTDYYLSQEILFTVEEKKKEFVCITLIPRELAKGEYGKD